MSINDTQMMFPAEFILQLADLRGSRWSEFVSEIEQSGHCSIEKIAFVYMIVRLSGCSTCTMDAFRAMKGCILCARHTIKRYKGSDEELIELFEHAKLDVLNFIGKET